MHHNLDKVKNGFGEEKKRKFSSVNDEVSEKTLKKKKIASSMNSGATFKGNKKTCMKLKNTDNYTKVMAKPEMLLPTPKIFKSEGQNVKHLNNLSSSFFLDFLTTKCIDSDVRNRFTNFGKTVRENGGNENSVDEQMDFGSDNQVEISSDQKDIKNSCAKKKNKKKCKKTNETLSSENDSTLDDDNKMRSRVDTYEMEKEGALIFHMHHPCTFSFQGELRFTVITGEVEILGSTAGASSILKTVDAYSPKLCTPLVVESKSQTASKSHLEIKEMLKDVLKEDATNELLSKLKPDDTILVVEQITSQFGGVINKYFSKPLFPKDLENMTLESKSLKDLQSTFNFTLSKNSNKFRKNSQWDDIYLSHCTVLCGGKGVGKSTLLRYYINKFVGQGEKILVLDFDPGQPEFTPPGCLSVVVVDKPLLGPNFTHLMDPEVMVYFGEVDVCQGPARYLECVKYLLNYVRSNDELLRMKWFVNTMGFSKGLGVDLMVTILKLVQPNTVIQIRSSDYKNNYPFYLTSTTVNSKMGFRSMALDDVYLSFELRVISSCAERKKKLLQGGLKPKEIRELLSLSYFSRMLFPPYYNFNAVQPYLVSFSKIFLGVDFLIPPHDILKAFNGSLVSLSHFEPGSEEILTTGPENADFFQIVVKPHITPSVAIAFIRGIDCEEKKFYVITHLSLEELEDVNLLYLGRLSPPHSLFLKQDTVEGQTYYTSVSTVDAIQRVKRMFRVPAP